MTIAEANRFYEQDKKKYELINNKEFNTWLNQIIKEGYYQFIEVESLQELIDNLVKWYEIKYPENEMKFYEGIKRYDFQDIKSLSKHMDINQLMFRLRHEQLCLLQSHYRSNGWFTRKVYDDNNKVIGYEPCISIRVPSINDEYSNISIHAVSSTGEIIDIIYDYELYSYNYKDLNDLLADEKLYEYKYDFSKVYLCLFEHSCDMELRRRVLQLAALKMLYSENTIPERGYERAKRFINEFNKKLNLDLTTEEIDEIMSKDYTIDPILDFGKDDVKKRKLSLFKK